MISPAAFSDAFVGRQEELELLGDAFRSACDGRSRFVRIEGEAGIGKSRLVREFSARLGDTALIAVGGCVEQIRRPYLPIEQVLERLGRRPRLPAPYDGRTHAEERAAYFQGVAEAIEKESARKPLAIVIEDVQWADDATIDLLRYLTTAIEDARVLVIITVRTATMLTSPALAALRLSLLRVRGPSIVLRGLRRFDIRNLIGNVVRDHATEIPLQTINTIESLCDGNPLFAEELTRIAIDSGEIVLGTASPLTAHAMLSERLATFSEDERNVLVRAAIVGQHFDAGFVAEIAGTTTDRVLATMQRALDHELVVADRVHPHRFAFRHSLIRQVLADRLVLGLAAPLHLRIARGIENGQHASKRAAELAFHYSEARVADKARYYNELAAQAAWDVYAYRDAIHFYSAALQWEYPPGLARAAIYERLGTLLYIEGVGEEPARWFERARAEYEQIEDEIGYCQALLMIADQRWVDARTSEGAQAASEAAARLERLGETRPWLSATLSVARYAVTLGDAQRAAALLDDIGRRHAHFDASLNVAFYEVRAETRAALGQAAGALADGARAVRLARETGSSELVAQVENNVALVAADLGELELAGEHHRNALAEAHRTGLLWRVAYCALNYAQTLAWGGELTRARAMVLEALDCGVTTATFKTKAAAVGVPLALALNDRALLLACSDERALEFARQSGEIQRVAAGGAAYAELLRAQGDAARARATLTETVACVVTSHRAWNLWSYVALCGRPPDVERAREILGRSTGRPRMMRAHRLLLEGHYAAAERVFARLGFRWHAALCAELAGDRERARQSYEAMGAVRDAARLAEPHVAGKTATGLTARQTQIAELVAQGEINRTIAARLHISEHTVEHHLTGIFARLGVKSRAQLIARWIASRS